MVPLLVLLTFLTIASAYALVQRSKQKELAASLAVTAPGMPDYQYTPGHIWLDRLATGHHRLGLDEILPKFMGQPDRIHLVDDGELVKKGEPLAIFSKGGKDVHLRAPVDMRVWKANRSLLREPQMLNLDPYHKAWLYHVSIEGESKRFMNFMTGEKAKSWMKAEMERLKEFVTSSVLTPAAVPNTAFDGGLLVDGMIEKVDKDVVTNFEQKFLLQA